VLDKENYDDYATDFKSEHIEEVLWIYFTLTHPPDVLWTLCRINI
jgi:hypothetical protein